MASTFESERARSGLARRGRLSLLAMIAALGCRAAGLPPEPPGRDAADAESEIPAYSPRPNPLSTSGFAGVKLGDGGHGHHHHGGHGKQPPKAEAAADQTEAQSPHEGHGSPAAADGGDMAPREERR